eukprot:c52306_g1_i1.p1 GENE.c52306_g1_i1~~c52306_g1_i1.p1  ORF type:complete len:683 (+),score=148.08 c52306_g1_i1:38-2050(+)
MASSLMNLAWLLGCICVSLSEVVTLFGQDFDSDQTFQIDLSNTNLNATIPTEIGRLTNLVVLDLKNTNLIGTLPSELGQLTSMFRLSLGDNHLTGTVPIEIANMTILFRLDLFGNLLTGSIPSEVGRLTRLDTADFSRNLLTGAIPTQIGLATGLTVLDVSINKFEGDLPSQIGQLTGLIVLDVSHNSFSGLLPSELGLLASLLVWRLSDTFLTTESTDLCVPAITCDSTLISPDVCQACSLGFPVLAALSAIIQGALVRNPVEANVGIGDTVILTFPPMPYTVVNITLAGTPALTVTPSSPIRQSVFQAVLTTASESGPVEVEVHLFHNSTGPLVQRNVTSGSLVAEIVVPDSPTPTPTPVTPKTTSNLGLIIGLAVGLGASALLCLAGMIVMVWRSQHRMDAWTKKLKQALKEEAVPSDLLDALKTIRFDLVTPQANSLSDTSPVSRIEMGPLRDPIRSGSVLLTRGSWQTLIETHKPEINKISGDASVRAEDAMAIRLYTIADPEIHHELTRVMSSCKLPELKPWLPYAKFLSNALEALPAQYKFSGTCYRGLKTVFPNETVHNLAFMYPDGKRFCWHPFTSTSCDESTMTQERFLGTTGPRTLFRIEVKLGYLISAFSAFPTETEVLLPACSQFRVISTEQRWSPTSDNLHDVVEVEQESTEPQAN